MRKVFALLAAFLLLSLGFITPATAAVTDGATLGTWTTTQACGSSTFTYHYDVIPRGAYQKQLILQWAEKTGPALSTWAPMINSQQSGALNLSLSGRGFFQQLGAVGAGTVRITKGEPAASGWSRVVLNYASTDTEGRKFQTNTNLCNTGTFDLTSNVEPPPPADISGTGFSMDFNCTSSFNTAYSSHWTWYYDVTGSNPNWTVVTTGLVRNSETGSPDTELGFAGNGHIVNGDQIPFTWTSGPAPGVDFSAIWGSDTYCEDPSPLTANF